MITRGRLGIGLHGEELGSTDPPFRTALAAGKEPAAFGATPFGAVQTGLGPRDLKLGFPSGWYGTGQLIIRWSF
jgi:hypothetical protein